MLVDQLLDLEEGLDEDAITALSAVKEPVKDANVMKLCSTLISKVHAVEGNDAMEVTGPEVSAVSPCDCSLTVLVMSLESRRRDEVLLLRMLPRRVTVTCETRELTRWHSDHLTGCRFLSGGARLRGTGRRGPGFGRRHPDFPGHRAPVLAAAGIAEPEGCQGHGQNGGDTGGQDRREAWRGPEGRVEPAARRGVDRELGGSPPRRPAQGVPGQPGPPHER